MTQSMTHFDVLEEKIIFLSSRMRLWIKERNFTQLMSVSYFFSGVTNFRERVTN